MKQETRERERCKQAYVKLLEAVEWCVGELVGWCVLVLVC